MKQILAIRGLASGKTIATFEMNSPINNKQSLMSFLLSHDITIASSCNGEGQCKKCVVNQNRLSCQISVQDFIQSQELTLVEVAYL